MTSTELPESHIISKIIRRKADPIFATYELLLQRWQGGQSLPHSWSTHNDKTTPRMPLQLNTLVQKTRTVDETEYRLPAIGKRAEIQKLDRTEMYRSLLKSLTEKAFTNDYKQKDVNINSRALPRVSFVLTKENESCKKGITCLQVSMSYHLDLLQRIIDYTGTETRQMYLLNGKVFFMICLLLFKMEYWLALTMCLRLDTSAMAHATR